MFLKGKERHFYLHHFSRNLNKGHFLKFWMKAVPNICLPRVPSDLSWRGWNHCETRIVVDDGVDVLITLACVAMLSYWTKLFHYPSSLLLSCKSCKGNAKLISFSFKSLEKNEVKFSKICHFCSVQPPRQMDLQKHKLLFPLFLLWCSVRGEGNIVLAGPWSEPWFSFLGLPISSCHNHESLSKCFLSFGERNHWQPGRAKDSLLLPFLSCFYYFCSVN